MKTFINICRILKEDNKLNVTELEKAYTFFI